MGGQIREWIRSLDAPDRHNASGLRSRGFEKHKGAYHYHYELLEGAGPDGQTRGKDASAGV